MSKLFREMRFTVFAAIAAIALILTAALTNVDLVRLNLRLLDGIEKHEVDDLLAGFLLILVGLMVDRVLSYRRSSPRQCEH